MSATFLDESSLSEESVIGRPSLQETNGNMKKVRGRKRTTISVQVQPIWNLTNFKMYFPRKELHMRAPENSYWWPSKKNGITSFSVRWMDLEIIILSEVSQTNTNTIWYYLYVESKMRHTWTYLWNKNRLTDVDNRLVVAKGEKGWSMDGLGIWD